MEEATPPYELRLGWQCERWHTLPEDGNLFGQDFSLMYRMTALLNIYNAVQHIKSLQDKPERIHELTHQERLILKMLMDMGVMFNA